MNFVQIIICIIMVPSNVFNYELQWLNEVLLFLFYFICGFVFRISLITIFLLFIFGFLIIFLFFVFLVFFLFIVLFLFFLFLFFLFIFLLFFSLFCLTRLNLLFSFIHLPCPANKNIHVLFSLNLRLSLHDTQKLLLGELQNLIAFKSVRCILHKSRDDNFFEIWGVVLCSVLEEMNQIL